MASLRVRLLLLACTCLFLLFFHCWLPPVNLTYGLLSLPVRWRHSSWPSFISEKHDNFDVTFSTYGINQSSVEPEYADLIPPILHHINLGTRPPRPEWLAARSNCLRHHEEWETRLWDDSKASAFIQENFPDLKDMWDNYPHPVQRVDALRYMILYKYGGVVLDFDLACKRSLGPLRRFDFVAPAAHPTGFSIGMLLASPNNTFVGELVRNLPTYNRSWFLLPYVTVMFSTGCHYASTLFTLQSHRTAIRILVGTGSDPHLHMLNGYADTPLFHHLGTSSWHSFDAFLITLMGNPRKGPLVILLVVASFLVGSLAAIYATMRIRIRDYMGKTNGASSILKDAYKSV